MLATGYKVDVSRYGFLSTGLLKQLGLSDGYPELSAGFESSVPGLHFVGAPAARSFGPLCRFVSGTRFTARALTPSGNKQKRIPPELLLDNAASCK
jgi:hypothetical protein